MKYGIPIWEKAILAIEEAAAIFNIGEHKLREITDSEDCTFVLWVGRKRLIKKKQFLDYIAKCYSI